MLRRSLVVFIALVGCSDDGNNRHLADAPPIPDMEIDAPIDAPIIPPEDLELGITASGNGSGRITSAPEGIDCGSTCTASFEEGTMVTLTAEPDASSLFTGWGGACTGTTPVCEVTLDAAKSVTATFTLKTYTVTVTKAGAGTGTVTGNGINCGTGAGCTVTVDHGTAISLAAAPANLNVFVGWGGACSGQSTCDLTITADTNISAAFALDELSLIVTRGGNGSGTITSSPAGINCPGTCDFVFTANQMVTLTAAAATSSTFTGWTGACTGTTTCTVTMNAAKTVTGTFTLKKYTLDVTKTGGTGTGTVTSTPAGIACGADCNEQYDHGSTIALAAAATTGHTFMGWSGGGCSGTAGCSVTLTAATTVNARFDINTYALSTSVTGSGSISSTPAGIACPGDCGQNYNHGTSVTLTQMADPGWTFSNWTGACSGSGACVVDMTQARTVGALFTINQYDLDVMVTGMGTVTAPQINCGSDCTGTYDYNTVVNLTQMAAVGYTFQSWGGACSGNTTCSVTMSQARNVTATFTLNKYALTVGEGGTGTGGVITATGISCPGDCTEDFNHGTVVAVTQVPNADSNFLNWSGDCTGTGPCNVTMNGVRSVTAVYQIKSYNLDVTVSGSGTVTHSTQISCPTDCQGTYPHGTQVTLVQQATAGWQFTGWTGACTGTGVCTVDMTQGRMVGATFTQLFALNVTINGSTGTVTSDIAGINCPTDCAQDYLKDTPVILTAAGTGGATFASWSGAPGCTTALTCTVTMSQARNVTATFDPPKFLLTAAFAGNGKGVITSSPIINCGNGSLGGSDCTETLVQSTMVTLTATPTTTVGSEASLFSGWTGCTSAAGTTCNVTMDAATTVTANFTMSPNIAFVTSTTTSIDFLASGTSGWQKRADDLCKAAADASGRGIVGTGPHQNTKYIAWLSGKDPVAGTVNVATRLAGVSGWERVDRRPFLNKLTDIDDDQIIWPLRLDENGADVGTNAVTFTGTNNLGMYSGSACESPASGLSYGSPQANGTQGLSSANSQQFTTLAGTQFGASCAGLRRLYCFGADRGAALTVSRSRGRLAFTTEGTWRANAGGLDSADALCRQEATAANLSGNFLALLSTTTVPALSRFGASANGEPWVRVGDQQPLTPRESDMRNPQLDTLQVAPNATATGQRLGNVEIWTGAPRPTAVAPNSSASCANWTNGSVTKSSGGLGYDTGVSTFWFGAADNVWDCGQPRHIVCFEN